MVRVNRLSFTKLILFEYNYIVRVKLSMIGRLIPDDAYRRSFFGLNSEVLGRGRVVFFHVRVSLVSAKGKWKRKRKNIILTIQRLWVYELQCVKLIIHGRQALVAFSPYPPHGQAFLLEYIFKPFFLSSSFSLLLPGVQSIISIRPLFSLSLSLSVCVCTMLWRMYCIRIYVDSELVWGRCTLV